MGTLELRKFQYCDDPLCLKPRIQDASYQFLASKDGPHDQNNAS